MNEEFWGQVTTSQILKISCCWSILCHSWDWRCQFWFTLGGEHFPSGSSRVTHLCYWPQVVMLRWAESWWEKSWVLSPAWTCPKWHLPKGQVKPWIKPLNRLKIGFKSLFLTMMFVFIFSFLVSFNKPSPIFDANQHEWIYMWGVGWGESLASQ